MRYINNEIFENRIVLIASKTIKHNRVLNHVDLQMEEILKRGELTERS